MYTQRDEEPVILRELAGIQNGRLLDIGAYDGLTFSTTLALIERGWGGVLVECSPNPFKAMRDRHVGRPNIEAIEGAVVPFALPGRKIRIHATDDALSTTEKAHRDKWAAGYNVKFTEMEVPAIPMSELVAKGPYDFVSIDTESTSVPLLAAFLAGLQPGQRPRLICVEHDDETPRLRGMFADTRYGIIHITAENTIARRID